MRKNVFITIKQAIMEYKIMCKVTLILEGEMYTIYAWLWDWFSSNRSEGCFTFFKIINNLMAMLSKCIDFLGIFRNTSSDYKYWRRLRNGIYIIPMHLNYWKHYDGNMTETFRKAKFLL